MADKIELRIRGSARKKEERRCVQISGEANAVLEELHRATGLPVGHIVSQMLIQGVNLVEIIEEEED